MLYIFLPRPTIWAVCLHIHSCTPPTQLDARITTLEEKLEQAPEALPEEAEFKDTDLDRSWMEFEFDTSQSSEIHERSKLRADVDLEAEASSAGWSVSGGN